MREARDIGLTDLGEEVRVLLPASTVLAARHFIFKGNKINGDEHEAI